MIEFKRDPYIFALYVVVIAAATILLWQHIITWDEVKGLAAGMLMPSLFGRKEQGEDVKSVTAKTKPANEPAKDVEIKEKKDEGEDTPPTGTVTSDEKKES